MQQSTRKKALNSVIFIQLPWPGESEGSFRFSSQTNCPPAYTTQGGSLFTLSFFTAESREAPIPAILQILIFIVVGLIRPRTDPESTVSVADALSTRPLIG